MACRLFVRATPNRMAASATSMATEFTTKGVTLAGVATLTSLPGAGAYYTLMAATSGTAARNLYIGLAGDGSNGLSCVFGTTQTDLGAGIVPTADGRWYLFAISKPTGSNAPVGYMVDMSNGNTLTTANGAATADRTAGAVTADVGSGAGADFWNGRIAMTTIINRNLSQGEILQLVNYRAWHAMHRDGLGHCPWLGQPSNRLDRLFNPALAWSTGTAPALDSQSPPGWP